MVNNYRPRGEPVRLFDSNVVATNSITGDLDEWTVPTDYEYFIKHMGVVTDNTITALGTTDPFVFIEDSTTTLVDQIHSYSDLVSQASDMKTFTLNSIAYTWFKIPKPLPLLFSSATELGWGGLDTDDDDTPINAFTGTGTDDDLMAVGMAGWTIKEAYHDYKLKDEALSRKRGTNFLKRINLADADYSSNLADVVTASNLGTNAYVIDEIHFSFLGSDDPLTECSIEIKKGGTTIWDIDNFLEVVASADEVVYNGVPAHTKAIWKLDEKMVLDDATTDYIEIDEIAASKLIVTFKGWYVPVTQWY